MGTGQAFILYAEWTALFQHYRIARKKNILQSVVLFMYNKLYSVFENNNKFHYSTYISENSNVF